MKVNIAGTGFTQKRVEHLLYVLWALDTPEQIGSCQDAYDSDKKTLAALVGRPFEMRLEITPLCPENVQSPEGENPRGPRYL